MLRGFCVSSILTGLFLFSAEASAQTGFDLGGRLQTNLRFRPSSIEVGDWYDRARIGSGVARSEQIVKIRGNGGVDDFGVVLDVDFVWINQPAGIEGIPDLSLRQATEPVRLEAHAAYFEATNLLAEGLDLRLGQQIVSFGVGDQFNPTNNLNAEDLEDRLLFGTQQANLMARLDFSKADFSLTGVVVPIFRPALLPSSGVLAITAIDRLPHLDVALRHRLHSEAAAAKESFDYATVVQSTQVDLPENTFENMQAFIRGSINVFEQDVALSYYKGRSDIPQPYRNDTFQAEGERCNPNDPEDCIDGLLQTQVSLRYPKVEVVGLNLTGEVDALGWISDSIVPIGYRFELGIYFPEAVEISMFQGPITFPGAPPEGEYEYALADGGRPLVLDDKPYAKWTLGIDYSFGEHVYLNLQWVHGLADEVGAGDFLSSGQSVRAGGVNSDENGTLNCALFRDGSNCAREILRNTIGDYLVVGADFRFNRGAGLIRLFTLLDLTGYTEERFSMSSGMRVRRTLGPFSTEGFTAVLFPEINYNFGNGLELGGGALFELGKAYTKFGDPAAGGSVIFTRGRYSF